ncbi:DUF2332 domain-containing protein [Aestuariimicrobium ganziense]|uniref:DUF2332 domain-containing protein n=1 Tax=Aestuariimicrobium ganziense TaxID=2773677 RepID=UPI00194403B7|nr:DUF2332 domain-containing protein [Aestuariimicrobium ganziense]
MEPAHTTDVAERYRRFAANETPQHSAVYTAWAQGVAGDPETAGLIGTLPLRERQPNLVFTVARAVSPGLVDTDQATARPDEYARLREVLHTRWDEVRALTATRHTQTNEAARLAVLLPAVHTIHKACGKPLALVELGASAGLLLHPQAWTHRYVSRDGDLLAEVTSTDPVGELDVTVKDPSVGLPDALPPIEWRVGLDLNPLDVRDPEVVEWLRLLVWPGQTHRLARLDAAIEVARRDPVLVLPRDITHPGVVDEALALIPRDLHPVVFHAAVQAYLSGDDRHSLSRRLLELSASGACSWVSYEGAQIVPPVDEALTDQQRAELRKGAFVVAIDGRPAYQADGHAHWIL